MSGGLPVELVIQTATALLSRRLAPREAVTILASQAPHARATGRGLAKSEPERAATYAALLSSLALELRAVGGDAQMVSVVAELYRVVEALTVT